MNDKDNITICVVGLGYVGLPLAIGFSKKYTTIGYDTDKKKIESYQKGIDPNEETKKESLAKSNISFSSEAEKIKEADFIIVAVPTPINKDFQPDMKYIISATETVANNMKKGSTIIYESTVYPGTTEDLCIPILESRSGLKYNTDFNVGYSPERINPGDNDHTIDKVTKIISSNNKETLAKMEEIYSHITKSLYLAKDMKTAEAAKVIENIQRDLNIALVNEFSIIFNKLGINTKEVIKAAATKWNFHDYNPGLVGGHCIPIDPYYLTYIAEKKGYSPRVILAGREINEQMSKYVCNQIIQRMNKEGINPENSKALVLGLTFKNNVKDIRNSKIADLINHLKSNGILVIGNDILLSKEEIKISFGIDSISINDIDSSINCIILATPHKEYLNLNLKEIKDKIAEKSIFFDIKNVYGKEEAEKIGFIYMSL